MDPLIKVRVDPPSGSIILNRPERRNALSCELVVALHQALDDLHQERRVRAVILTGSGSAFCAGKDMLEMHATASHESATQMWHEQSVAYRELLLAMLRFPKPIIASVNGPAHGAGAGLALASDIVVAAHSATFAIPGPLRGVVAGMVVPLLVFRIAAGQASNLLLTSRTIDSEEAHRIGIFHELTADDLVWARAHQIAGECAAAAHEAVALTKRMLNETVGEHLTTMLSMGAAVTATSKTTEAAEEGMRAFLEKRPPAWP